MYTYIRILKTQIKFHRNMFNIQLIMRQHWFRQWIRIEQSTSHCLIWTNTAWFNDSSLRWRHNGHDGVSNHQPHHCLLTVYSGADQRKHQSSASLAFMRRIHRGPVARKMFSFDDVIMMHASLGFSELGKESIKIAILSDSTWNTLLCD